MSQNHIPLESLHTPSSQPLRTVFSDADSPADTFSRSVTRFVPWQRMILAAMCGGLMSGFQPAKSLAKEISYEEFRELAMQVIENNEVTIERPNIRVEDGALAYDLGGGEFVMEPEPETFDLVAETLRAQMQVELIREYAAKAEEEEIWEPVLKQVETMIATQLEIAQDTGLSEEDRFSAVMKNKQEIRKVYDHAMGQRARDLDVFLQRSRPFRPPHTVQLVTNPEAGRIYLIHAVERRLADVQGRKPKWRPVPDPEKVQLEGKYHYLVQWADETVVGEEPVLIDRDGEFVLQ